MVSILQSNETLVEKITPTTTTTTTTTAQWKRKEEDTTISFFPLSDLQVLHHPLFFCLLFLNFHASSSSSFTPGPPMEKNRIASFLVSFIITFLGLTASGLCVAAEFKRSKKEDVRVNGKLCYLAESGAFHLGVAALICLCTAHVVGSMVVCRRICSGERRSNGRAKAPWITSTLLVLSWISFGVAVILMGTATSMNRRQPYKEGWLDGKCYLVKDGVYISLAVLVMVTIGFTIGLVFMTGRKSQAEQDQRIHAQQHK